MTKPVLASRLAGAVWGHPSRTQSATACLLREAGLEADEALDRVHAARKHTLTRGEQQRYVRAWPPG